MDFVPTTLTQDEMDDALVNTHKANEMDLYIHGVNKERYETMLQTLPDGKFKDRITGLLAETNDRILEVSSILDATTPQLPPAERVTASLDRAKADITAAKASA